MQPSCVRGTAVVGTCQVLSAGRPDLIHTKAFLSVPLSLTTTSSDLAGVLCAFMHAGTADISRVFGVGLAPLKITLPVMVAPFSKSGIAAAPPAGVAEASVLGASVF